MLLASRRHAHANRHADRHHDLAHQRADLADTTEETQAGRHVHHDGFLIAERDLRREAQQTEGDLALHISLALDAPVVHQRVRR